MPARVDPASDFEDDLALGEELHRELVAQFGLETEAWATEQVQRVAERLQEVREPASPFQPEILWIATVSAFTVPGRYLYLSRELQQRAASDDPIALVLAHEIAHHELGHFNAFRKRLGPLSRVPGALPVSALLRAAEWMLIGPEAETDADARALDLCRAAGYDGRKCLELFDILEAYALNHRDLDMVYGPDEALEETPAGLKSWIGHARIWTWQRMRGYVPIRDRRETLDYLLQFRSGTGRQTPSP